MAEHLEQAVSRAHLRGRDGGSACIEGAWVLRDGGRRGGTGEGRRQVKGKEVRGMMVDQVEGREGNKLRGSVQPCMHVDHN